MSRTPKEVVTGLIAAMNAHDVTAAKGFLAPDFVRYGVDANWEGMSRAEYLGLWDNYFQPFPDLNWKVLSVIAEGNEVAVSMIETATMTGVWNLRGKVIEPNNRAYETHVGLFFAVAGDQIAHYKYMGAGTPGKTFMDCYGALLQTPTADATLPDILVD